MNRDFTRTFRQGFAFLRDWVCYRVTVANLEAKNDYVCAAIPTAVPSDRVAVVAAVLGETFASIDGK